MSIKLRQNNQYTYNSVLCTEEPLQRQCMCWEDQVPIKSLKTPWGLFPLHRKQGVSSGPSCGKELIPLEPSQSPAKPSINQAQSLLINIYFLNDLLSLFTIYTVAPKYNCASMSHLNYMNDTVSCNKISTKLHLYKEA